MTTDATVICPHCGNSAAAMAAFCGSCGLALPSAAPTTPRVVTVKDSARTTAGQKLQADELLRTAKRAASTLLTIGIINLAFGALNVQLIMRIGRLGQLHYMEAMTASMLIAGALYVAMFFWAKFNPLAATIAGLAVYIVKWVADVVIRSALYHATSATSGSVNTYQIVRIFMVFYLIGGIAAAMKHRKLLREPQQAGGPVPVIPA
jgi:hypothetical protein